MTRPIKEKFGYRLHFCFKGKQYRHSVLQNEKHATVLQNRVNTLISEFKLGFLKLPQNVPLPTFIFGQALGKELPKEICHTTLLELVEQYQEQSRPPVKAESSWKTEQVHFRTLYKFLVRNRREQITLGEITVNFFNEYKQFRYRAGIRTDTVKKELGTLQALFRYAVECKYIESNPVREVRRDKSQVPPNRFRTLSEIGKALESADYEPAEKREIKRFAYLNPTEIAELIDLARDTWLYPILVLLAHTGVRRGEIVKLEWADVDFERRTLYVASQKQSRRQIIKRSIEMTDALFDTLTELRLKTGGGRHVFAAADGKRLTVGTLRETFRRLVKGTKFEGVGFHVFRHSLASNLAAAGVDQRIIDSILGHQTEEMRQRYRHLFPNQQRQALQKLVGQ